MRDSIDIGSDPNFLRLISGLGFEKLHRNRATAFGLWPDLTLAYYNCGWKRFASENGGEPRISTQWRLGRNVLEAIAAPLRLFFADHYLRCLRDGRPWEHLYECSSDRIARLFHMVAFPLGNAQGILVVNSLRQAVPDQRVGSPPIEAIYRNNDGLIVQCCHCRRVCRHADEATWDWVPQWVAALPHDVSHGICDPCQSYHCSAPATSHSDLVKSFKTCVEEVKVGLEQTIMLDWP